MVRKTYRAKGVLPLFGFSLSELYDQIDKGEFPQPNIKVGSRGVGWTEDLLEEEQERRIAARALLVGRAS